MFQKIFTLYNIFIMKLVSNLNLTTYKRQKSNVLMKTIVNIFPLHINLLNLQGFANNETTTCLALIFSLFMFYFVSFLLFIFALE